MKLNKSQLRQIIREELLAERSSGDRTLDKKLNAAHKALTDCEKALDALDDYLLDNYVKSDMGDASHAMYASIMSVLSHLSDVEEDQIGNLKDTISRMEF